MAMRDYEELVKRLINCASDTVEDCAGCPYQGGYKGTYCMNGLISEAADAIEELQRICDAMKHKYDAVCVKCAYYAEAKYNDKGFLICPASGMDITALDFCSYFTLPEPPKEETP